MFFIEEEGVPPYDELIFIVNNEKIDKEMLTLFLDSIEKSLFIEPMMLLKLMLGMENPGQR